MMFQGIDNDNVSMDDLRSSGESHDASIVQAPSVLDKLINYDVSRQVIASSQAMEM